MILSIFFRLQTGKQKKTHAKRIYEAQALYLVASMASKQLILSPNAHLDGILRSFFQQFP